MDYIYEYDKEHHFSSVIITDKYNRPYVGAAFIHPEDIEFANEKTGLSIAYSRAQVKYLTNKIIDLKEQLHGLKVYYYSINQSKQFNPESYEAKMLNRQIKRIEHEIILTKHTRDNIKENIKNYIKEKDIFYNKIRKQRKGKND